MKALIKTVRALLLAAILTTGNALAQECAAASGESLRVGVLPVMNTLPLFVAQQEGFYDAAGLSVELVPVESARDRSIGLQTGELDVGNNDVPGAALQVAAGDQLKIVRHDSFAMGERFFSIVTSASSGLDSPEALIQALRDDTAQIALGHNTVTEYIATRLLRDAGYEPQLNDYLEVSAIPLRLEQVAQGTVAAALLPEPLTTLATTVQGGFAVLNDSDIHFVPVALTVRQQVLDEREGDVCRFLAAYQQAVEAVNAQPEVFRANEIRIPEQVQDIYLVPSFNVARVPTEAELAEVQAWMVETGLLDAALPYEELVDDRFVPAP